MEILLSRYRNLSILLLVILAQLVLLAYQVKSDQNVRLIRVWSVTAVTPLARALEFVRQNTIGVAERYFVLLDVRGENEKLKEQIGQLKLENRFLKTELETADRVRALAEFQSRTQSRTVPARIIGTGTGANSRVVFIDQGSGKGIMRGMAVITPDGIVGKVLAAYPTASQVLLVTDPAFAAGVISDRNRVHGTVKGQGQTKLRVDYVQNEEKVETGEIFYTSGDDRIFPKGMPVGKVSVVRKGQDFQEITLVPLGFQQGLEEVLVVIEGVHGDIPDPKTAQASGNVYVLPPPPDSVPKQQAAPAATPGAGAPSTGTAADAPAPALMTEADKLRRKYKKLGETQGLTYGEGGRIPDFTADPNAPPPAPAKPPAPRSGATGAGQSTPAAPAPATPAPQPR